jgi:dihydrofolate reductase
MSNATRPTVTLHLVSSLDGFIAKKDNSISWMDSSDVYERGVTDDGAEEVLQSIDCYVLGSRTYEHALQLGWPYGDTPTVVVTNRELPSTRESVEFYCGDLEKLVGEILAPRYGSVWLVGGAMLGQSFLRLGLVDEIRLMIAPVTLGDGLHLFGDSAPEQQWHLKNVVAYKNGYVDLSYVRQSTGSLT